LRHLLHPRVLQRLIDAAEYGNTFGIDEHMNSLTDGIFKADLRSSVSTPRQMLQIEYVRGLIQALGPKSKYDVISQSMVLSTLKRIKREQRNASSPNALTRAHRDHLIFLIEKALEA
jgi:hypothetical protein